MIFYRKFLFFVFLYSISNDKLSLLESTDLSAGSTPGSGAGTHVTKPLTDPSGSPASKPLASTNEGQQASGTPTSDSTTPGTDAGSGTKTGVELSLKATAETNEFNYNKNDKIVTYTAKDNYGFKSVKTGDKVVWETDKEAEYANKVVLNGKGQKKKMVTIHKNDNSKIYCLRDSKGKEWYSYDTSKTNIVSVNIAYKEDSFKYTSKVEGETRTLEAKDGFVFNQVRGKKCVDRFTIWKTDKKNEYSKKVVIDNNDKVTIHFNDGGTKVFNKVSDNNWTEDTESSTKETNDQKTS